MHVTCLLLLDCEKMYLVSTNYGAEGCGETLLREPDGNPKVGNNLVYYYIEN